MTVVSVLFQVDIFSSFLLFSAILALRCFPFSTVVEIFYFCAGVVWRKEEALVELTVIAARFCIIHNTLQVSLSLTFH